MIRLFSMEVGSRLVLGVLLYGLFRMAFGAETTVVLSFPDGSAEVCATPDPWRLDYTTFNFTNVRCQPDKIFAADFETNRPESAQ